MRVPNLSSTIAFYPREFEQSDINQLTPLWQTITILAKGSVTEVPNKPTLLDVIVPYNKYIVKSMRATIDGSLIQYAITGYFVLGNKEFIRLVFDTEDFIELPPVTDFVGPITVHTKTDLVGFLKGDGYNVYADTSGGSESTPQGASFTYTDGIVTRVDYEDGTYKLINYNIDGSVDNIVWDKLSVTVTTTMVYNPDGSLAETLVSIV